MKKNLSKLRSHKGESFVEILIAILIVAFGCLLLASMFSASFDLNTSAQQKDKEFYQSISDMESESNLVDDDFQVTITETDGNGTTCGASVNVNTNKYGDENGLTSYRKN